MAGAVSLGDAVVVRETNPGLSSGKGFELAVNTTVVQLSGLGMRPFKKKPPLVDVIFTT